MIDMPCRRSLTVIVLTIAVTVLTGVSAVPCPSKCACTKEIVDCSGRKLPGIPTDIPTTVTRLQLGQNLITRIPAGSFSNLTDLRWLSLKNNELFSEYVDVDAFRGLKKLKYLFLTSNKLKALEREMFTDLTSLQKLYLSQNEMTEIPDLSYCVGLTRFGIDNNRLKSAHFPDGFGKLRNLSTIVLSNNQIASIKFDDLKSLNNSNIRAIDLARCGLSLLDGSIFAMFPHLQSVNLGYNSFNLTSLRNIMRHLQTSQISSLGLGGIKTDRLPGDFFANFSAVPLITLDMSLSQIDLLDNGTFTSLKRLQHLYLSRSKIVVIADGAFGDIGVNLTLKLDNNNLETVPPGLPPSLQQLDLSHNVIDKLSAHQFINLRNLLKLNLANCKIHQIVNDAFDGVNNLNVLNLDYNTFGGSNIGNKVLQPLIHLKTLSLKGNRMKTIPTQSKLFESLTELEALDMSDNDCTDIAPGIFGSLKSLKTLDLSGNDLGLYVDQHASEIFAHLTKLENLNVKNSHLYRLPMELFSDLTSLNKLILTNNQIAEWERGLFRGMGLLKIVNLSSNGIAVINKTSVEDLPDGVVLDLTENPFSCWCDLTWFRNWIDSQANSSRVSLPGNASYQCHSPTSMVGKSVLDFRPESIHRNCFPLPWMEIIISAVTGTVALFTAFIMVIYKYRWSLKLRWYKMRRPFPSGRRRESNYARLDSDDEEPHYDVCVLYGPNKDDCKWVKSMLIPEIDKTKSGKWKVFFEERDALPNKSDIGQIASAIYSSDTIILVLSSAYVSDSRRLYEIELVFSSVQTRRAKCEDVIIPVLLDEYAGVTMPRLLHPLIRNDYHLTWTESSTDGQSLFRNKLMDRLTKLVNRVDVAEA